MNFSIEFPNRSPHGLSRYYQSPVFSAGAGHIVERPTKPRWVGETADGFLVELYGLDERLQSYASTGSFSARVTGNPWFASVGLGHESPLAFFNDTPPLSRMFFLGFQSFFWPQSEEISFPDGNSIVQTSRRSIRLNKAPEVYIYEAGSRVNLPGGAWFAYETEMESGEVSRFSSHSEWSFISFLIGRRANCFWRDSFVDSSTLRRIYVGSERVQLDKLRDVLPPLPLWHASKASLAQDVIAHLPSLFGAYSRVNSSINLSFILAPLWSAANGLLTEQLALACVSLERLANKWKNYNCDSSNELKRPFWTPTQRRKVRSALTSAVDSLASDAELTQNQIKVIKNRLNQLGQQTNADQLMAIFADLGLTLSDFEKEAINKRNFALHGKPTLTDYGSMPEIAAEILRYDTIRMVITKAVLALLEYRGPYISYAARSPHRDFPIEWQPAKADEACSILNLAEARHSHNPTAE